MKLYSVIITKIIWTIKSEALKKIENVIYKNRFIDEISKRNNFGINDDDIVIKDEKKKLAVIISQQESRKLFCYQLFCQIAIYTKITIRIYYVV